MLGDKPMKILSDKRCVIGEGPIWCERDGKLYHVNAPEKEIITIDLCSGERVVRKLDFSVAAIAFSKNGEMLVSSADGAFILNVDNTRTPLYDIEKYSIKYGNDAKVGPDGRFYIGTQSAKRRGACEAVDGKLYSIDKTGKVRVLLDGLKLSNGFDWSMDEKRFYHTDSDTRMIREYDFDKASGDISFTGREIHIRGVDGFTVDTNDFLYVACWAQSHIAVVDTRDMQIKEYIEMPTQIPTSCAFAGQNMDKLVVVSSTLDLDTDVDKKAGYTFIVELETRGRKPYLFG